MNIVIVGGGTAGWSVSLYLASMRPQHNYTTIESPDVPTIGVGEAVTGKFTNFLQECNVDLLDFMINTDALPKHAIRFDHWLGQDSSYDIPLECSVSHSNFIDDRLFLQVLDSCPIEHASVSGFLSLNNRVGWSMENNQLTNHIFHAFQFDEAKGGKYLRKLAVQRGVTHIEDTIEHVVVNNDTVTELKTQHGRSIKADLYIDCSGLRRLLISKVGASFKDSSQYVNVNSSLMFRPEQDVQLPRSFVSSLARKNGWNFEITTRHRTGRGYLYNSNITNKEEIKQELTEIYGPITELKHIEWQPGSLDQVWIGNVISIGLSASFLEPLQAGTIHDCLILTKDLIETGLSDTINQEVVQGFNNRAARLFNDYLDLINISYVSDRQDSDFWKFVKHDQKRTTRVEKILSLSQTRLTRELDFDKFMGYANQGLFNYGLAGLGLVNKHTIKKVFSDNNIDIEKLRRTQKMFEQEQNTRISKYLTTKEFNDILKKQSLAK
jgi:tryptophan halogenase